MSRLTIFIILFLLICQNSYGGNLIYWDFWKIPDNNRQEYKKPDNCKLPECKRDEKGNKMWWNKYTKTWWKNE